MSPLQEFTLQPTTPEGFEERVRLGYESRKDYPFTAARYPSTAKTHEQRLEYTLRHARYFSPPDQKPDPNEIQAVSSSGQILGYARWTPPSFHPHTSSTSSSAPTPAPPPAPLDPSREAEKAYLKSNLDPIIFQSMSTEYSKAEKEAFPNGDERYWVLDNIVVRKEAKGKGVGSALLKWGLDKADEEGLPIFLLSSAEGYELYSRRGFAVTKEVVFKGGDGKEYPERAMVRPAQSAKSN